MSARVKAVSVRLTHVQHAELATMAARMGCSVSDLLRRQIDSLLHPAVPTTGNSLITISGLTGATCGATWRLR